MIFGEWIGMISLLLIIFGEVKIGGIRLGEVGFGEIGIGEMGFGDIRMIFGEVGIWIGEAGMIFGEMNGNDINYIRQKWKSAELD